MLKEIGDEAAIKIGLYTCDPAEVVKSFPRILPERNNSLLIEGKMAFSKFEPYIDKVIHLTYLTLLTL